MATSSEPIYDVLIEHDIMVAVRDGVRLATHVYFPAKDGERLPGKHPVLLNRTPYRKEDTDGFPLVWMGNMHGLTRLMFLTQKQRIL